MTRRVLAVVALAAAFAAVPASAESLVETTACPPGDRGVIVRTAGRQLTVCTNIV